MRDWICLVMVLFGFVCIGFGLYVLHPALLLIMLGFIFIIIGAR